MLSQTYPDQRRDRSWWLIPNWRVRSMMNIGGT